MRPKTLGRICGAVEASIFGYLGYEFLPGFCEYVLSGNPIEYKLAAGGLLATTSTIVVLGVADGLTDVVKGTHHYFGCKLFKKFARNERGKKEIDDQIKSQLELD